MKKLLYIAAIVFVLFVCVWFSASAATSVFQTFQGGTGTSSPSGILYGDNSATTHLNTVTIGTGLIFSAGILSSTGSGTGNVSTSSSETSGRIPFWTSTAATPALLSGGSSAFVWDNSNSRHGIGTSTPFSTLSVSTLSQQSGLLALFTIASTTNTELFRVNGNGSVVAASGALNITSTGGIQTTSGITAGGGAPAPAIGQISVYGSGTQLGALVGSAASAGGLNLPSLAHIGWASTANSQGTLDTGLSRLAASVLSVDTGTVGNTAGTLVAANIGVGTTSPFGILTVSDNTANSNLTAFLISSSTASATTTLLNVANTGQTTFVAGSGARTSITFAGIGNNYGFYEADASHIALADSNTTAAQVAFGASSGISLGNTNGVYFSNSGSAIGTIDIGIRRIAVNTLATINTSTNGTVGLPSGTFLTGVFGAGATTTPGGIAGIAGQAGGTINLLTISSSTSGFATSTALVVSNLGNLHMLNGTGIDVGYGIAPPVNGLIASGKVGIGTSSPTGQLSVVNSDDSVPALLVRTNSTVPSACPLRLETNTGATMLSDCYLSTIGSNSLSLFVSGNVAFGGTAVVPNAIVQVAANLSDPTTASYGASISRTLVLTATNSNAVTGGSFQVSLNGSNFNQTGVIAGGLFTVQNSNIATLTDGRGGDFLFYNTGAGTVTKAYGGHFTIQNLVSGGAITNAYGVYVGGGFNNGTITNLYGSYIDTLVSATSTWGYYENSTAPNYFAGKLGIGTTSPFVGLDLASTSASANTTLGFGQLTLTDTNAGTNLKHWLSTSEGGNFYLGTTTDKFATTTTAVLTINQNGFLGIGTSSPGTQLAIGGIANFSTATSSLYGTGGMNIAAGCYAIGGVCIGSSGGGGTNFWTSSGGNIYNNTGARVQFAAFDATSTSATSTVNQSLTVGNTSMAPLLQLGSTTPGYGYLPNDRLNIVDNRNDYAAGNAYNLSNGNCATADWTVANDLNSTALNFGDLGHTSSGFTGVGCTNNPFPGFSFDSTYLFDPSGNINFALGSTTVAQFRWFTGGYTTANEKMVLTNGGFLGVGTTSPGSLLSVGNTQGINFTTATSSFATTGGVNITNGCYAIGGVCIPGGGSGTVTSVATDATLTGGPITTTGTLGINLANSNNWTALQNFNTPGLAASVSTNSWYGIGGKIFAYASSTNQATLLGIEAGSNSATTSPSNFGGLTAVGYRTLTGATKDGTAVGALALEFNTTGFSNVAVGGSALKGTAGSPITGGDNSAFGTSAGGGINTGNRNILIGSHAATLLISGSGNIIIGAYVEPPSSTSDGQLNVGNVLYGTGIYNSNSASSAISALGKLSIGTTTPFVPFELASTSASKGMFAQLALTDNNAGTNLKHWVFSSEGGQLYIGTTSDAFASTTIAALTLTTNGTLGVGTTTPQNKLDVNGSTLFEPVTDLVTTYNGSFWYSSVAQAFSGWVSGIQQWFVTSPYVMTTQNVVSNTSSETSILGTAANTSVGSTTLPANFWTAGKTVEIRLGGIYGTKTITPGNLTIKVKWGSTVLASETLNALLSAASGAGWDGTVDITCQSVSAGNCVFSVAGHILYAVANPAATNLQPIYGDINNSGNTTSSSITSSQRLDVTATWATADVANIATTTVASMKVIH